MTDRQIDGLANLFWKWSGRVLVNHPRRQFFRARPAQYSPMISICAEISLKKPLGGGGANRETCRDGTRGIKSQPVEPLSIVVSTNSNSWLAAAYAGRAVA